MKINYIENYQSVHSYISLDTETTGLYPKYGDRIIQISAVKVIDDQIVDKLNLYVNPDGITNNAEFVNNISDEELATQPAFKDVWLKVAEFVEDLPWLGHNIIFDLRFLNSEGVNEFPEVIDTLLIARRTLGPSGNSLARLENKFKIQNDRQHDSLEDALATIELFNILREKPLLPKKHRSYSYKSVKHKIAEKEDDLLNGMRIVISGHFEQGSRDELQHIIERHGGKSPNSVSKITDYLMLGTQTAPNLTDNKNHHSKKELNAIKYGIPIISYDDLVQMLKEG